MATIDPVIGPMGNPFTLDDLPPASTRWVARRKAEVVVAVESGLLALNDALNRYDLTLEEFTSWQRGVERSGLAGLRTTKIQHYRAVWARRGA